MCVHLWRFCPRRHRSIHAGSGSRFVGELESRDPRGFPFNHTNFGVGNQTISNLNAFTAVGGLNGSPAGITGNAGNAGQIFAIVGTSRQIQLGLKFIF